MPYIHWAIPEKIQTVVVEDILFWKAPLEILDLSLYPKKFRRKKAFNPGNSANMWHPLEIPKSKTKTHGNSALVFLEHPWNFHFFFNWPLEFPHVFSSRPPEIPCPQPPCLDFFWNSPLHLKFSRHFFIKICKIQPSDLLFLVVFSYLLNFINYISRGNSYYF